MIIYNVTVKVDWLIHEDWIKWMKEEHVPFMLATKLFYQYQLVKLLQVDETDGPTYAVQYYAFTLEDYNRFLTGPYLLQNQASFQKWGDKLVAFSTLMEVVP